MFSHRRGAKHFGEVFDADRWSGVGHVRRYGSTGAPIAWGKFRHVVQCGGGSRSGHSGDFGGSGSSGGPDLASGRVLIVG
jgi:hypothetical protein